MSDKSKSKSKKSGKSSKGKKDKSKKSSKAKARAEKAAARKGDGSFPDVLVVTKEKNKETGKSWFLGHKEDLETLYTNGEVVAVYKLRRVSTVDIRRKVTR